MNLERYQDELSALNRRAFLCRAGATLGTAALWNLLEPQHALAAGGGQAPLSAGSHGFNTQLHHPARIKRVIQLYMAGGPSHLETFDYKPKLVELHGKPMPESLTK